MNWIRLERQNLCLFRSTTWHSKESTWIQDRQSPTSKHSLWSLNRSQQLFSTFSAVANCADIFDAQSVTICSTIRRRYSVSVRYLRYALRNITPPSSCCDLATGLSTSSCGLSVMSCLDHCSVGCYQ